MRIVLGANNSKTQKFAKKYNALLAEEMCGIKFLTKEVEIYIPYAKITDDGLIEGTMLYIDEVLITLNVKEVFYGIPISSKLLNDLSFYKVKFTQL